jgi:hypothetical protein
MDTTENVLGKNVIHAVSNPLRMFAGAIHIYAGTSSASSVVSGPGTPSRNVHDMAHARSAFAEANARWARESSEGH